MSTQPLARLRFERIVAVALALLGTIALAPAASAQDWLPEQHERWINTGGYFVIGGITGWENFQNVGGQDFDASLGFEIRGGARLNKYLAVEVGGDFLSGFETNITLPTTPTPPISDLDVTLDGGNVTANILAYLPLGRIQPYALVGLGGMWARLRTSNTVGYSCFPSWYGYWYCSGEYAQLDNDGGFVMKFGGGVDFYVTEAWALTVDATYVKPFGDIDFLDYVSLGWGLRFSF